MSNNELSRRTFLHGLGAATVLSAMGVSPWLVKNSQNFVPTVDTLKVGVVLPKQTISANAFTSFMQGLTMQREQNLETSLSFSTIFTERSLRHTFGSLIENHAPDVVVAFIGAYGASMIAEQLGELRRPILIVNPGGNKNEGFAAKNIHVHSLSHAALNFAGAQQAVQVYGRRGVVLSSFYDSGFDTVYAAEQGIKAAGGTILESWMTNGPYSLFDGGRTIAKLSALKPNFVYSLHSGTHGDAFHQMWSNHPIRHDIPLITNEFASQIDADVRVAHWSSSQPQLSSFQPADSLTLLGYETRLFIDEAAQIKAENNDAAYLNEAFRNAIIDSPRRVFPKSGTR